MILSWPQFQYLLTAGVPAPAIVYPYLPETFTDAHGARWLHFPDDDVDWRPTTGELRGRWCLGEDAITDPDTYWNGDALRVYATPLEWMIAGRRRGVVIRDWSMVFDRLRDVPRVSVPAGLVAQYRKWMKPTRVPEMAVTA